MSRDVSIFLDLARLLAALAVFISHAAWHDHTGGLLWQLEGIGQEAVDVFFVLSGFVISHVVATRETAARDYVVNRIARVASVAVPALAATCLLDALGATLRPGLYRGFCCDPHVSLATQYLRNLVFTGDVWWDHIAPGSDIPYWSLGYEAWYYFAFGLYGFLPPRWRIAAAAGAMMLAGPGIAVLFPLWLLGPLCRRAIRWTPHDARIAPALALAAGLLGLCAVTVLAHRQDQIYAAFDLTAGRWTDYGQDYLIGLLFALSVWGVAGTGRLLSALLRAIERPVRWLAGGTFALYLFHLPLMRFAVAISPWPAAALPTRLAVLLGVPLVTIWVASVTERRKAVWRDGLLRVLGARPLEAK